MDFDLNQWQRTKDSAFHYKCWRRWWGQSGRPVGARSVIHYAEDELTGVGPTVLYATRGRIYVREEYVDAAERLQAKIDSGLTGKATIVTGHPGIGTLVIPSIPAPQKHRQINLWPLYPYSPSPGSQSNFHVQPFGQPTPMCILRCDRCL